MGDQVFQMHPGSNGVMAEMAQGMGRADLAERQLGTIRPAYTIAQGWFECHALHPLGSRAKQTKHDAADHNIRV